MNLFSIAFSFLPIYVSVLELKCIGKIGS